MLCPEAVHYRVPFDDSTCDAGSRYVFLGLDWLGSRDGHLRWSTRLDTQMSRGKKLIGGVIELDDEKPIMGDIHPGRMGV